MPDMWGVVVGVLLGSTIGTVIATEIAYRRTEKWLIKLLNDEKFKGHVVAFLKDVAQRFRKEYVESGELRKLVQGLAKELLPKPPSFEEFLEDL